MTKGSEIVRVKLWAYVRRVAPSTKIVYGKKDGGIMKEMCIGSDSSRFRNFTGYWPIGEVSYPRQIGTTQGL